MRRWIGLWILGLGVLAATGCGYFNLQKSSNLPLLKVTENKVFQFAAPWDQGMFDGFYKQTKAAPDIGMVKGGVVPHHLLAGYMPATFFNHLSKQKPSLIVLIGPNHFDTGKKPIISSFRDWQTPYGTLQTDQSLVKKLLAEDLISVDEETMKGEHSINSLTSFISKSLPNAKVVSLILKYKTPTSTLNLLVENLEKNLPDDAVVVASVDFSHYMTWPVADFHDELSKQVIKNFDYSRIDNLEIDSPASVYTLLKLMEYYGIQKIGYELHDNAAQLMNDPSLEETTSHYSPYFINGEKSTDKVASLLFFGDMMLDRNVKKQIDTYGPDWIFEKLAGKENRFFSGVDLISANLEGPFADKRRPTSKSIAFRFDPILIPTLKKFNFSLFSQANNHSYDMGNDGFIESKNNLTKAGLDFYGSQYRIDDSSMIIKTVGDYKIAFIGINDTNSPVDTVAVDALVKSGKTRADFVIMNVHWGAEYKEISNNNQRQLAHEFIDAGVDIIVGHHPHVIQEIEIYKNRPIFYSLGNFIFDQYFSTTTQQGLAVGLILKDKEISVSVFPLAETKSQPYLMLFENATTSMYNIISRSRLGDNKFQNFNLKLN